MADNNNWDHTRSILTNIVKHHSRRIIGAGELTFPEIMSVLLKFSLDLALVSLHIPLAISELDNARDLIESYPKKGNCFY